MTDRVLAAREKKPLTPVARPVGARSCLDDHRLQRKAIGSDLSPSDVPSIVHEVLRSPGKPLDTATRSLFEPRYGMDFSNVRVHTDAKAAQSARAVHASAYTVGQDVVFGANRYAPATHEGRRLIAHELTHVIQQAELQVPRLQRQPIFLRGARGSIETDPMAESDLGETEIERMARRQRRPKDRQGFPDLSQASNPAPTQRNRCTEDCLNQSASLERVSGITLREKGPVFDVLDCYSALTDAAAKGRPSLTPEAGCAQCITGCSDMDLDEAVTTCRDELLNQCIVLTDSWKRFVRRPF